MDYSSFSHTTSSGTTSALQDPPPDSHAGSPLEFHQSSASSNYAPALGPHPLYFPHPSPAFAPQYQPPPSWPQYNTPVWPDGLTDQVPPAYAFDSGSGTIVDNYPLVQWGYFNPEATLGYHLPRTGILDTPPYSSYPAALSSASITGTSTPIETLLPPLPPQASPPPPSQIPAMDGRKRPHSTQQDVQSRDAKRSRQSDQFRSDMKIEQVDLVDEEDNALLEKQREELVKSQRAADDDSAPKSFSDMTCIICMDNFTDLTATPCGHIFCHECLTQALMAGERTNGNVGSCPVCRKTLRRNAKNNMIPLSLMTKSQYQRSASRIGL